MKKEVIVFITASSEQEAKRIAHLLLDHKKAACVTIIPGVSSHFFWDQKKENSQEVLLLVKSMDSVLPDIIALVKKIHSYDTPEIIAVPVQGGDKDYLTWLRENVE